MDARLVSYDGEKIALAFPLQGARAAVGRENDNEIQLPHAKVSKHHAVLRPSKSGWIIEDLQSTNGLLVNGEKAQRADLKHGDRVQIGPYELRYETKAPSDEWFPSYLMDLSPQIHEQTLRQTKPPNKRGQQLDGK
jgi:predicted component of type VI protein secretion system